MALSLLKSYGAGICAQKQPLHSPLRQWGSSCISPGEVQTELCANSAVLEEPRAVVWLHLQLLQGLTWE